MGQDHQALVAVVAVVAAAVGAVALASVAASGRRAACPTIGPSWPGSPRGWTARRGPSGGWARHRSRRRPSAPWRRPPWRCPASCSPSCPRGNRPTRVTLSLDWPNTSSGFREFTRRSFRATFGGLGGERDVALPAQHPEEPSSQQPGQLGPAMVGRHVGGINDAAHGHNSTLTPTTAFPSGPARHPARVVIGPARRRPFTVHLPVGGSECRDRGPPPGLRVLAGAAGAHTMRG